MGRVSQTKIAEALPQGAARTSPSGTPEGLQLPPLEVIIGNTLLFGAVLWILIRAHRKRPKFEKSEMVHQEWFASGNSERNIITKIGGAQNCLRLIVTQNYLVVTSWFPFSLITPLYDLEHLIPLDSITSVQHSRFLGQKSLLLSYRDARQTERKIRLSPKSPDELVKKLGVKPGNLAQSKP